MKNMKIKTKLILGFAIPVLLTMITVLLSIWITKDCVKTLAQMNEESAVELNEHFHENLNDEQSAELMQIVNEGKDHRIERMESLMGIANLISAGLLAVAVILTLIISTALIKVIMRSIRDLSSAAQEIAMGRVNDIQLQKYNNDEFGELIDEYIQVIDNIKYQANIAEEVAAGNLTISVKPASADDMLGNSLKKLVEDNLNAMSNISEAGSQVTISSSQVASASQALAQGSTEQASAIQQITASIDEIAEKTKQNAEQANEYPCTECGC